MKLVLISDTHGHHESLRLPDGDCLVHAGDLSEDFDDKSLAKFLAWLELQPHKHKVFIAGNHDFLFEKNPAVAKKMVEDYAPSCTYLQDSGCEIDGVRFWGTPVTPRFFDWAFNRKPGHELNRHWDLIPNETDVLITHGPPFVPGDEYRLDISSWKNRCGDRGLYDAINRVQPELHVFGHIHSGYGTYRLTHDMGNRTTLVNASICNERYYPIHKPFVLDIF